MSPSIESVLLAVVVIVLVVTLILYSFGLGRSFNVAAKIASPDTTTGNALSSGAVLLVVNMLLLALMSIGAVVAYYKKGDASMPGGPIAGLVVSMLFLVFFFILAIVGATKNGRKMKTVLTYVWASLIFQLVSLVVLAYQWVTSAAGDSATKAIKARADAMFGGSRQFGSAPGVVSAAGVDADAVKKENEKVKSWFGTANALIFGVAFLSVYGIVSCIYTLKHFHASGVSDRVNAALSADNASDDERQPLPAS